MKHFLRTRTLVIVALASVVLAIAIPFLRVARDPYGVVLRLEFEEQPVEKPATSPYSQIYHTDYARLINDILRKSSWAPDDEAWLLQVVGEGWPEEIEPPDWGKDQTVYEEHSLYDMALSIVADRVGREFPVTPDVHDAFEIAVLSDLESPFWRVRHSAVANIGSARWVNHRKFRPVLERIARSDPDMRVARNAQRRLRHADGLPDTGNAQPCPTCPSKGG